VVLQLEASGSWPDDVEAIKAVKGAFYLQIAKEIEAANKKKGAQKLECLPQRNHVDIITPSGLRFRFYVQQTREIVLLERATDSTSLEKAIVS